MKIGLIILYKEKDRMTIVKSQLFPFVPFFFFTVPVKPPVKGITLYRSYKSVRI